MKYILLSVCLFSTLGLFAQDKKKGKEQKTPVYNYTVGESPMDAFYQGEHSNTYIYMPEFYSRSPSRVKDTTYKFECYDARDSIVNADTVNNNNEIRFISLFKNYTDSSHLSTNPRNNTDFVPVSRIIRRYDRVGNDKWMSIDYANNKYTQLKESRTYVVRTDTITVTDPKTNKGSSIIFCYYKVETIK